MYLFMTHPIGSPSEIWYGWQFTIRKMYTSLLFAWVPKLSLLRMKLGNQISPSQLQSTPVCYCMARILPSSLSLLVQEKIHPLFVLLALSASKLSEPQCYLPRAGQRFGQI